MLNKFRTCMIIYIYWVRGSVCDERVKYLCIKWMLILYRREKLLAKSKKTMLCLRDHKCNECTTHNIHRHTYTYDTVVTTFIHLNWRCPLFLYCVCVRARVMQSMYVIFICIVLCNGAGLYAKDSVSARW